MVGGRVRKRTKFPSSHSGFLFHRDDEAEQANNNINSVVFYKMGTLTRG